jgi:hypothetical protein
MLEQADTASAAASIGPVRFKARKMSSIIGFPPLDRRSRP